MQKAVGCLENGRMRMREDAELLVGMSRKLSTYAVSSAHAALDSLQYAAQVHELAWRPRESILPSATRVDVPLLPAP